MILAALMCLYFKKVNIFLKNKLSIIYNFLKEKWYFDELYELIFVKLFKYIGNGFWKSIDVELIDNVGPNGISKIVKNLGQFVSSLQTGYLFHYVLTILIGLTVFISIYFYLF